MDRIDILLFKLIKATSKIVKVLPLVGLANASSMRFTVQIYFNSKWFDSKTVPTYVALILSGTQFDNS